LEIAPPFYRSGADRPSATPAVAAGRAPVTSTVRHRFRSFPHNVMHFVEIEADVSPHLCARDLSGAISTIDGFLVHPELLRELLDRHPRTLHRCAPLVVLHDGADLTGRSR
jgi:hypothetical protein